MTKHSYIFILLLASTLTKGTSQCADYVWTTWSDFTDYSAIGTIQTSDGPVLLSMTTDYSFDSYPFIFNYNLFDNYPGSLPENAISPCTTWFDGQNGETNFCFSKTVEDPYLLISTLGNINTPVTITFSLPYEVIYDGGGMMWVNDTTITGQEGYGIIKFPGSVDCVQAHSISQEWCTIISWGIPDDNPPFDIDFSGDTVACVTTTITASGGQTYSWSGGQNPNSPTNQFTESGNYTVTVTDDNGCTSVGDVEIMLHPDYETSFQQEICSGEGYTFNGQYLTQPGIYEAVFPTVNDCDSVVMLHLFLYPTHTVQTAATICEGETYPFQNVDLDETGLYTAVLPDQNGCDSTIILDLTVVQASTDMVYQAICPGESFLFNGQVLSDAGIYTAVLTNTFGCDSTIILDLDVLPFLMFPMDAEICAGTTYPFGGTDLSLSGIYQDTFPAVDGCDSIFILNLTVLPELSSATTISICEGDSLLFGGDTLTQTGTYSSVFSSFGGCDSTVVLNLVVQANSSFRDTLSLCQGETTVFMGDTLSAPGTYTAMAINQAGCDSLIHLDLLVWSTPSIALTTQICPGGSYSFNGQILTNPGTYTANLQTVHGCDSTVTLTLDVQSIILTQDAADICPGETWLFGGQALTQPGTYSDTLVSIGGCDSISILELGLLTIPPGMESGEICSGESQTWNGQVLDQAGTYNATLTSAQGCDSTSSLTLIVHPTFSIPVQAQICTGQTYWFNGQSLSNPGSYTANLQTSEGCDSTVQLTLSIATILTTDLDAAICAGEQYAFGGSTLSSAGTYADTLTSSGGCDSLVTLTLTVHPMSTEETYLETCAGAPVVFEGDTLTVSGTYTAQFQTVNGCDSTAILYLTVHPAYDQIDIVQACDVYTWPVNGQTYTQSTVITDQGQTVHGCDSSTQLILTIHPSWKQVDSVTTTDPNYLWPVNQSVYTQTGTYVANGTTSAGCDSVHILHLILLRTGIYIPTAFSPNNDGINDRFTIYGGSDLVLIESMTIYDRWGNKLATYADLPPGNPEYGWDGKSRDQPLDPGVYVFTGTLLMSDESQRLVKGEVTVVK